MYNKSCLADLLLAFPQESICHIQGRTYMRSNLFHTLKELLISNFPCWHLSRRGGGIVCLYGRVCVCVCVRVWEKWIAVVFLHQFLLHFYFYHLSFSLTPFEIHRLSNMLSFVHCGTSHRGINMQIKCWQCKRYSFCNISMKGKLTSGPTWSFCNLLQQNWAWICCDISDISLDSCETVYALICLSLGLI